MNLHDQIEEVRDELHYLGFSLPIEALIEQVNSGLDKFSLNGKTEQLNYGIKEALRFEVFFKAYDPIDFGYKAYMYKASLEENPNRETYFRIKGDSTFSARESFNLLKGRVVSKTSMDWEDVKIDRQWFQLDFEARDIHGNHELRKFDLDKQTLRMIRSLDLQPIKGILDKNTWYPIVVSLLEGNTVPITLEKNGKEVHGFVEGDPHKGVLKVYSQTPDLKLKLVENSGKQMPWHLPLQNAMKKKGRGI